MKPPVELSYLALGMLVGACGLASLDPYFECPGRGPDCAESAGAGDGGAIVGGGAGLEAGGGTGGASADAGQGGDAGMPGPQAGGGSAGSCALSAECPGGICFRGECGPTFELTYADTPTDLEPRNAQWIKFQFQIKNRTATTTPLSALKLRYYYSPENVVSELQVLAVSSPLASDSDVLGQFGLSDESGARHWTYLELGFKDGAGMLKEGDRTGPIKVGVHDANFGPGRFDQLNDYSYLHVEHITLYLDSTWVSGQAPSAPPATDPG